MQPPFPFLMYCSAALLGLGITLLFLVLISWFLVDQLTFMQRAPTTIVQGKITSITIDSPGTDDASCHARVQFYTNHKQSIEIINSLSSSTGMGVTHCNGQVGDVVNVAYHITDPHDARAIPPGGFLLGNWVWFAAFIFILLGGGFMTLSAFRGLLRGYL